MASSPDFEVTTIESFLALPRDDDRKVVVQARDSLKIFRWMEIDGQDGLGGGQYYGGFNFVIDDFARDPSEGDICGHLLETSDHRILRIADINAGLLACELEVNLLTEQEVSGLVIGESLSLRKARLENAKKLTVEQETARLRTYRHCGSCTETDCYCVRR